MVFHSVLKYAAVKVLVEVDMVSFKFANLFENVLLKIWTLPSVVNVMFIILA